MKSALFAFAILLSLPASASQPWDFMKVWMEAPVAKLPLVQAQQFKVGNFWIWNYFENGDRAKFYSSEKYTVIANAGDRITFEITTMYAGKTEYTPSARFTARLSDCTRSFSGGRHHYFTIEMYAYSNGSWSKEPFQMRSTAFEEKFNCNPFEYSWKNPLYETVYDVAATKWGTHSTFQQKPRVANQILSYYFVDHPQMAGIAQKKDFNADSPYEFEMELADFEMK